MSGNDWATPETIAYALKNWIPWQSMWAGRINGRIIPGLILTELSYYEALKKIGKYNMDLAINLLGTAPDKEMWADDLCVLECNAFTVIRIIP